MLKTYRSARPGAAPMLEEIPLPNEMGVKCPGCGLVVETWRMIDLRDAPPEAQNTLRARTRPAPGYDDRTALFRCDGCLSYFERNGVEIPDVSAPGGKRRFREDVIMEWHGLDQELIDRARDALDLRDARQREKLQAGVYREDEFRKRHAALIARIEARGKYRRP